MLWDEKKLTWEICDILIFIRKHFTSISESKMTACNTWQVSGREQTIIHRLIMSTFHFALSHCLTKGNLIVIEPVPSGQASSVHTAKGTTWLPLLSLLTFAVKIWIKPASTIIAAVGGFYQAGVSSRDLVCNPVQLQNCLLYSAFCHHTNDHIW